VRLTTLPWDSEFFGVSIARAVLEEAELAEIVAAAREESVECLYLVVPEANPAIVAAAVAAGATFVDLRAELGRELPPPEPTGRTRLATSADVGWVLTLSADLADFSRFRADPRFPRTRIGEMYRIWARRCLDDGVVVVPESEAAGFVGAQLDGGETHIELVYVAPEARGQRFGQALVGDALAALPARRAHVATRAGNSASQRLYQSLGFRTESVEAVLHLWLDS